MRGVAQPQDGFGRSEKERVASTARHKLDAGIGLAAVGLEAERQLAVRVGDSNALTMINRVNRGGGRTASVDCRDCKNRDDGAQRYGFHGSSAPKTRSSGQVRSERRNLRVSFRTEYEIVAPRSVLWVN